MKRIKNIIIVYDYGYIDGGAATVAINTAIELSNIPALNVYYFCGTGPVCNELINSKVNCICLNQKDINHRKTIDTLFSGIFNKKAYFAFFKFLKNFSPKDTLVHLHDWCHSLSSSVLKATNALGFHRIITLHDYFLICPNGGLINYKTHSICDKKPLSFNCITCNCDKRNYAQKIWRVIRQKKQNKYLNEKESFIYLSDFSLKIIKPFFPKANYYYFPNHINNFRYKSTGLLGKDSFLFLGRVSAEKGVDLFCKAINETHSKGIIIGDGDILPMLKEEYGDIQFLGWQNKEQIEKVLPKIIALVFPSVWYEVSPLTVPELLEANIPCIVSNCCAAKDFIKDGRNGFIFNINSLDDLKEKIYRSKSLIYQKQLYTERSINDLISIYNSVLNTFEGKI